MERKEILDKMRFEIECVRIDSWKEEYKIIEFDDFNIRMIYSECEESDYHPNYKMSLKFEKCQYFEEISIYKYSDCRMCNKDAMKEMVEELMKDFEKQLDRFYNEDREIDLRIKGHKKEIRKYKDKIRKLEFYKSCDVIGGKDD